VAVNKAFTLVELVVVLAITAIFLTVAVPSFIEFIQNNRVSTLTNELTSMIQIARMEAIKRGFPVSVCPAGSAQLTSCGGQGNWQMGWIVFLDRNNTGAPQAVSDIIKGSPVDTANVTIVGDVGVLTFDNNGFLMTPSANFNLRPETCSGAHQNQVTVSASGQVSIVNQAC
jgi:type IV fimbrial biogenesis protein FimT